LKKNSEGMFVDLKIKNLFGLMVGATIVFVLYGLWKKEFDWNFIVIFTVGGLIGHFGVVFIQCRKSK
jgi:hypothetical protein